MLHILWLILKFILITLGAILGFILFMLLLVLICPIRYDAFVDKESENWKEVGAGGGVSWLFYLIIVKVRYQMGKVDFDLILFGIPVMKVLNWLKNRKKKKESSQVDEIPGGEVLSEQEEEKPQKEVLSIEEQKPEETVSGSEPEVPEISEAEPEPIEEPEEVSEPVIPEEIPEPSKEKEKSEEERVKKEKQRKIKKEKPDAKASAKEKPPKESFGKKIENLVEKIKGAIQNAEETKAKIQKKVDEWREFLGHKKTKAAIKLVFRALIRIVKHVLPTKFWGDVTFGSEDPSLMGNVLIATSVTIPFHKNSVRLTPVFNEGNIVQGHLKLKGRIIIIVIVAHALRVVCSRNTWFVINHFRKKQEG